MNDMLRPTPKLPKDEPRAQVMPSPAQLVAPTHPPRVLDAPGSLSLAGPKKRIWLRWLIGVVLFLVVAVAVAGMAAYFWYQGALNPVSTEMHNTSFKVADGAGVDQIADNLAKAGLVRSGLATQIYMRLNNQTNIKAGNYVLSPNQSVAEITNWLNEGRVDTLRVTILPGRTLKDLKGDLAQYGFSQAAIDAALNKKWEHPVLADKPADVNLEGYIYPETYFMSANTTPEELILRSFDQFESQIEAKGLRGKLSERGFNLHQGVALASLISGEVSSAEDQRIVSQVFQTRLNDGMVLGSDVSYIYAAELLGLEPSPQIESPYNTRKYPGLPPGATSNFNLSALEAVVNPANTNYLFFVAGDDGVTHYSFTFAEHEANIAKYCHRICASN